MKQSVTNLSPKISNKYSCECCDYNTYKKSDYKKHLLTIKHKNRDYETNTNDLKPKIAENRSCVCGRIFNNRTALWRHKKKCNLTNHDENYNNQKLTDIDKDQLIITLLKQNADLIKGQQDMVIKLTENGITNNSHNTHTNSHNKAFNLNFFLN